MNKPIRVLHILQRMEAGGTQALLMNIYRNIDRNKIQFDFLVEYPDKQFYDDEIKKLGGNIFYTSVRKNFNLFKFQNELTKVLKENNYKIVHIHAYTIGYFALKTAKKCGVPIRIAHSHSNNMTKDLKRYIKKIMQRLYLVYATDYMACSKEAGNYLFRNKKFEVLNNAIDSRKFIFNNAIRETIRKDLQLKDEFIVGHIGRFKEEKNHKFLIKVFKEIKAKIPNSKLVLIGEGPLKKDIKNIIAKEEIENETLLLGNKENVNELLQIMDVFIFPSFYEGLGIAAIEAQAAGTPTIISDGVPDETIISPICMKKSLNNSVNEWASTAIKLSENVLAHTNMQKYVIDNGYDLDKTVKWIENYYVDKFKEIKNAK